MITDLSESEINSIELTTEVCIIGAGAAGITLAMEFEKSGIKTILLEGGGYQFPVEEELDLYDAKLGDKPYPVAASRLRFFGGSTNHWGGWSRCLDEFDMIEKPYFPATGWPLKKHDLTRFYQRAAEICEIPNLFEADNGYYADKLDDAVINWSGNGFENKYFVFSPPTRFGKKYLPALKFSQNVKTYLHANATELMFSGKQIVGVKAASLNGNKITVNAKKTILAMGGLENPRFMLNNQSDDFEHGVGNHTDWLGRCFMDHPGFQPINLLLTEKLKYKRFSFENHAIMPVISMNTETLLSNELNNFCILLSQKQHDKTINREYASNSWLNQKYNYANYSAQFIFEPSPCRDSRVTLTDEKDLMGMFKLKLDWRFNDRDFRSVEKIIRALITHVGANNVGRIQWHKFFDQPNIQNIGGGMHHAGTTRMSNSAADGVVDTNCKVHQSDGLYVAGNSVFPHVGFSNPTVTIVALAVRLAEHIKESMT